MSDLRVQFGRRLRALRIEREMTQEDLANAAGVSTVFISSIERGKYAPSFDKLAKLASALHVSVKDLVTDRVIMGHAEPPCVGQPWAPGVGHGEPPGVYHPWSPGMGQV